jgi:hypothetical protein
MQETELNPNTNSNHLSIKGYTLEIEENDHKIRTGTYVSNKIKYKRRKDLEMKNGHIVVLDLSLGITLRVVNIYRSFKPKDASEIDFFEHQISCLESLITEHVIIMGDFNIDLHRTSYQNFNWTRCKNNLLSFAEEQILTQIVTEPTWYRPHNDTIKHSLLDHIYRTNNIVATTPEHSDTVYSDHQLIMTSITVTKTTNKQTDEQVWTRNWHCYSNEKLRTRLLQENWSNSYNKAQDLYNWIVNKLVTIADELAPLTKRKIINNSSYHVKNNRSLVNKHRRLVSKWKKKGDKASKIEADRVKKQLRKILQDNRKNIIRKHIRNGNSKTLWDAVKVARDENTASIPNKVHWNDTEYKNEEIASAFSEFFENKVTGIVKETRIQTNVYNGIRIFNEENKHFMQSPDVLLVMKNLKIKNCEGYDRLPLRILSEGAEILAPVLANLFDKIYHERAVPSQWKTAKVIPLHKKGDFSDIKNYRPISNLCTMSKIFEKLVLKRLWQISDKHRIDLTGDTQHGFKPKRSTITAALTIQSIISRALNEDKFVVAASLDLSAAFDVVNRDLLFTRLETMGIPQDVVEILKDWLSDRQSYVEVRGNSSYMKISDCGTVQGSVLGPVLFSIFIRPIYDIEDITTYADDNYVVKESGQLSDALRQVEKSVATVSEWLKSSGLKVNEAKTELCVFHKSKDVSIEMELCKHKIKNRDNMNILGILFDKHLNWKDHINKAVTEANQRLFALKVIKRYFSNSELKSLLTSLFFSSLYYGSEIWHLPKLSAELKKKLKRTSANALKIYLDQVTPFTTHTEIHLMAQRSPPENYCLYKHAILMYKLFNDCIPALEHLHLNFQLADNERSEFLNFTRNDNFRVGANILINRFTELNGLINKNWLLLSLNSYKIKCKSIFLNVEQSPIPI